jgi:hypothetical protein
LHRLARAVNGCGCWLGSSTRTAVGVDEMAEAVMAREFNRLYYLYQNILI